MSKQDGFVEHIVQFAEEEVLAFIEDHNDEVFYAFAFDCNPETYGIYLSFNTEKAFDKSLKAYRNSEYALLYADEEQVRRLRYNPGDWEYQNFVSIEFIYQEKIKELFDVVLDKDGKELLRFAEIAMNSFKKTEVYEKIPKTKDFIAYCIDHEEDELAAIERAIRIN